MFNDLFKGKKVIITGNSGFKGSWLSLWLNKLGASVHGISYKPPSELNMFEYLEPPLKKNRLIPKRIAKTIPIFDFPIYLNILFKLLLL